MPDLRQRPRVAYHTKVRLRASGRDHSVVARVENLSQGGIFVRAKEVPATGTEVLCRLLLDGERRTLKGRVSWVSAPAQMDSGSAAGAGIHFFELSRQDSEILARISQPGSGGVQPVDVWFEGMAAPIKSQAVITADGLQLATRLPFLRLQSTVKVSFVRDGVEEVRTGTLDAVTLDPSHLDGVPRIQVGVSTPLAESVRGTIHVRVPTPTTVTLETEVPGQPRMMIDHAAVSVRANASSELSDKTVVGPPPRGLERALDRTLTLRRALLGRWVQFIGSARRAGVSLWADRRGASSAARAALRLYRRAPRSARWSVLAGVIVVASLATLFARNERRSISPEIGLPASASAKTQIIQIAPVPAETVRAARQESGLAAGAPVETNGRASAPAIERQTEPPPPLPEGVKLQMDSEGSTLLIPISGPSKGVEHYLLADPPGVAVNLPRARVTVVPGSHRIDQGAFKSLLVQRRNGAAHLRLFLADADTAKPKVVVESNVLRVSISRQ